MGNSQHAIDELPPDRLCCGGEGQIIKTVNGVAIWVDPPEGGGGPHTHTLADVTDAGGAAALDVGTSAGTVCAGDDARLSDARTPTAHTHTLADITDAGDAAGLDVGTTAGTVAAGDHTHPGGGSALDAWPVGSVFLSVVSTSPATLLGGGTWVAIAAGRVLVGFDSGDSDFNAEEKTGGAKTVAAAGVCSGGAVNDHASHTHTYADVINHTHPINVTDPQHNHTQNSHNHTQDAHSHVITSQTATTGGATSYEHGTLDTSSAETEATETTATAVATNQAATATNIAAPTGITCASSNPAGGVETGATAGPSATLSHSVTQPTFTGSATSVVQPYFTVRIWKRTA